MQLVPLNEMVCLFALFFFNPYTCDSAKLKYFGGSRCSVCVSATRRNAKCDNNFIVAFLLRILVYAPQNKIFKQGIGLWAT